MSLKGRKALITGAGRGLGRALAIELARRGATVALLARTREELERVRAEIEETGGTAEVIVDDVGDPEAATRIAGLAAALVGPLDILVHNASSLGPVPMPFLADLPPAQLADVFGVNTFGPFRLTAAVVGSMVLRRSGLVLSISSDAAQEAYEGWGAYAASKAALDHMSRTWAAELAESGVRFVSVDPGEMDTQMHADALPDADPATLSKPADVARGIADLVEDEAAAPTGTRVALTAEAVR